MYVYFSDLFRHAGTGVTAGAVATSAPKVVGRGGMENALLVARDRSAFFTAVTCGN